MKKIAFNLLLSGLAAYFPLSLRGATNTWTGGNGDWGVAANWSTGAVPGPADSVVIPAGPAIAVTHSSNNDVVLNVSSEQTLVLSGGTITVTAGVSQLDGSFIVSSGATLGAVGGSTSLSCSGPMAADDANFSISDGAAVSLPTLQNFTKECNGGNWAVIGTNSVLNLPALTNITGQPCNYPTIEAEDGGQILAPNLATIEAGPLGFDADGTNSLIDLSGLISANGQAGFLVTFEASSGGTIRMPNYSGGPLVGVTIHPGGTIPTSQLQALNSLALPVVTNDFDSLGSLVNLTVSGLTINFPALTNFDDGNVGLSGGAVVTMPGVKNYTKLSCNGGNWNVTDSGTVFSLLALTNLSGPPCSYPVIQAQAGGQILLPNLVSVLVAPMAFLAAGANSLIDLGGLTNCAGEQGYLVTFEASGGGTINIANMTGGPLIGVTIDPGGTIPTAQIQMLNTLNLPGTTNNFNNLGTLANLNVTGVTMNFPALTNFDDGNILLTGGAVVNMPAVQNYTKLSCNGDNWTVSGNGSVFNLPALTNIAGQTCSFPVIQAEAGGQILLPHLGGIQLGPLAFNADGAGSLIDLSSLAGGAGQQGYLLTFEASDGGTLLMPNMTGGPLTGVTINPGGTIPTAQIQVLNSLTLPGLTNNFNGLTTLVNLTASGVTMTFPALTNFDDGTLSLSDGAVVTLPALQNYTRLSCSGTYWTVTGPGSILDLPALTNISGMTCSYPVIQAAAGGEILVTNLGNVVLAPLAFQADGSNSLIDLSGLTNGSGQNGYYLTFEASGGGTLLIPKFQTAQWTGFTFNAGGSMTPSNLTSLYRGNITVPTGAITFPALQNMDATSLNVTGGATLSLPEVGNYAGGTSVNASWQVSGTGSQISLPALTNLTGDTASYGYNLSLAASAGGQLLLNNLQSIADGDVTLLSDGAGSVINLTSVSGMVIQNGMGSLTAQNDGAILLNTQAFLLANVSINIPAGNPVLPPTLIASSSLTLYGQAWHSYLVQEHNILNPSSGIVPILVPLTNAFEAIAPTAPANTAYTVTEFVANPPLLQLVPTTGQLQLTLYGATNLTYAIQSTLDVSATNSWTNSATVAMTNAFHIFPPAPATQPQFFYRAKQL